MIKRETRVIVREQQCGMLLIEKDKRALPLRTGPNTRVHMIMSLLVSLSNKVVVPLLL